MKVNAYRIGKDNSLKCITSDQATQDLSNAASRLWIDIEQPSVDDLSDLLAPLDLHPLVFESCLESAASPPLAPYEKCLFIRFPIHKEFDSSEISFLCIIVLNNAIVTVHRSPLPALEKLEEDYSTTMQFQVAGTSAILYHLIDRLIDEDIAFTLTSRRRIELLAEKMENESSAILINELQALKRIVERLTDTFEDQRFSVTSLQTVEMELLDISKLHFHFRDTLAHLEYALTSVDRQQRHLAELYQHHLLALQDKTNRRLKILTILSAVFMPLTLIAGIYGMNFRHMPELNWPYAYPAVLIIMIIIAALLLWNFVRKGWFD